MQTTVVDLATQMDHREGNHDQFHVPSAGPIPSHCVVADPHNVSNYHLLAKQSIELSSASIQKAESLNKKLHAINNHSKVIKTKVSPLGMELEKEEHRI